jgi:hypothetical protein
MKQIKVGRETTDLNHCKDIQWEGLRPEINKKKKRKWISSFHSKAKHLITKHPNENANHKIWEEQPQQEGQWIVAAMNVI